MSSDTKKAGPVKVALTGGIGSGKSTALSMFAARGASVLNSDHIVHKLLQRRDVREMISERLGIAQISAGEEGRSMLAEVVFADESKLDALQDILFPLVREVVDSWMETDKVRQASLAVVELPMLFEAGMPDMFDHVVLITAPAELRQLRLVAKISRADFERRASRQLSEEEKSSRADFTYDNSGSPEQLDAFIAETVATVTPRT